MVTPARPEAEVRRIFALIQEAVDKGYAPPGYVRGHGEKGALRIVNDQIGCGDRCYAMRCLHDAEQKYGLKLKLLPPPDVSIPPNDFAEREASRRGARGFSPVLAGFEITKTSATLDKDGAVVRQSVQQKPARGDVFEPPDGHAVKGVSALIDADGREIAKWVKTTNAAAPDPLKLLAEFEDAFRDFKPAAKPVTAPEVDDKDLMTVYPWSDPHFGLLVWGREARDDWDLKIAVESFERVFASVVERTPRTETAILCVGGDTLHADDNLNVTPRQRHPLSVDGRHQKVFVTAGQTIASVADRLLRRHAGIEIIVLPGNHDPTSSFPLAAFLWAWFRHEPRLTVDLSPAVHRFRQFGKVGIGFSHGHTIKKDDLHTVFAQDAAKIWGETEHRVFHTFHIHKDSVRDRGGCRIESHGVIVPPDVFAYGAGYGAARHQKSIVYHRERGWRGTVTETV